MNKILILLKKHRIKKIYNKYNKYNGNDKKISIILCFKIIKMLLQMHLLYTKKNWY